jgi:predicted nucleotidyltransferase
MAKDHSEPGELRNLGLATAAIFAILRANGSREKPAGGRGPWTGYDTAGYDEHMSTIPRRKDPRTGLYYPNLVPLSAIRRYARQIAERFQPERIILFGSYAYGSPRPDSDVDLLVVMPTRNQVRQAIQIDEALPRGFALDLLVRTPKTLANRLRWGDWFLREVVSRGKVLYEKSDAGMGGKGRRRFPHRAQTAPRAAAAE